MVYLKSVENVITLDKLIGLLFLFCLPLLSILLLKTKRNDLARPVMGTIFLVRPHKQTSLFHIPARIQYLDLNWSRARGKCAELAFWIGVYESGKVSY